MLSRPCAGVPLVPATQLSSPAEHGQLSACLEDSNCVTSETAALLLTLPNPLKPILRATQEQWSALPCGWIDLAVGDAPSMIPCKMRQLKLLSATQNTPFCF